MEKNAIGGQAVVEGVMMMGPSNWAVAVRKPDGQITYKTQRIDRLVNKYPILKKPIVRGLVNLVQTLVIGLKAINYSANVSLGEEEESLSTTQTVLTFAAAIALTIGLFMAIPYFATRFIGRLTNSHVLFTLTEGMIRIGIFIAYIYVISFFKDIKRVFQYHGAEHKVINAIDAGLEPTVENAQKFSTIHPSCGTTFIIIVFIMAVIVFSFLPTTSFILRMVGKILIVPFIAGISYEIIRFARSHRDSTLMKIIISPGLLLQKLTTKEPDDNQVEVARCALEKVMEVENAG
ncbi:MAG: DUF1385 domain-containing protein [Actinobacteria bacterium]|nr:MAG: DUF1385 domain-containing protein [Actinomycetota bacterium]